MSSKARARLDQLNTGTTAGTSIQSHSQNMPARNSNTYGPTWGNGNIWGSPIGSGIASATQTNRSSNRPAPLVKASFALGEENDDNFSETQDEVTGSGSLLRSSESEGWSGRWPSMSNISALGSGLASARSNHTGTSPVRHRTTQHNRSSSPYFAAQPSAIGTSTSTKSVAGSMLDPTSRSFEASNLYNGFSPAVNGRHEGDDVGRRNLNPISSGNAIGDVGPPYTGYNSSVASRSGSIPPSRHGNDPNSQFGDGIGSTMYSANPDPFLLDRQPQHSRTSTFSNVNGTKFSSQAWQTSMGDLSGLAGRLDLGRDTGDYPLGNYWDQPSQAQSPGSINSVPVGTFLNGRHNSISVDTTAGLMPNSLSQYGQHRHQYADRQSYSPTGSDLRRKNDSPMYFSGSTPPVPNHNRALSAHSSRANLNAYNQSFLDRKLRGLAEQQSYQLNPNAPFRGPYNNPADYSSAASQGFSRLNTQPPYYQDRMILQTGTANQRMPPRGPASELSGPSDTLHSALLDEFRNNKGSRRFELKDIYNHVVEFSGDQHGSRFIQQKLETANSDEKAQLFAEILPNSLQLMTDVFGNYVIQKFFEHGNQQQKKQLADKMKGHIPELSLQMYGCRVVQKAFEHILVDQQASLIKELENQVLKCVKDQNGNHVIQKAIQRIPAEHITFIINAFTGQVHHLATHSYGCRVIQRMLEKCIEPAKTNILDELHVCASTLIVDQFGNYVTQHIIEHGRPSDRVRIISIITGNLVGFAMQKFASNVVETSIQYATPEQRKEIITVISSVEDRGEANMHRLMRDQFGNYVIQKLIRRLQEPGVALPGEYEDFVEMLRPHLQRLKQYSYGKQIGQIERLITSGPQPTLTTAQPPTPAQVSPTSSTSDRRPPQLEISNTPPPPLITEDTQSPQSSSQPSTSHSTVDEPLGENTTGAPRKTSATRVEIADDVTITAATATPTGTET